MGAIVTSSTITKYSDQSYDNVGGGVAGCATASATERTSWEVLLEEQGTCLRDEAAISVGFGLPILATERRVNCGDVI